MTRNADDGAIESEHQRVLELLRRFGYNATSYQILEPGYRYWFYGEEACVAFVDTGRAWVVAGEPIAAEKRQAQIVDAFLANARSHQRRVAFFATERPFATIDGMKSLLIGEQPTWQPGDWDSVIRGVKSLRSQMRCAASKQIIIRRWSLDATPQVVRERQLIEKLIAEWADNKPIPLLRFLVDLNPFSFSNERRYYVANYHNKYVGFAVLAPVFARNGWLIENLIRAHDAPNGTSELLVDAAMRDAALSGNEYVTLGMVPLSGAVDVWLRIVKKYGAFFYNFRGLKAFKAKFRPNEWSRIYLTYPREQSGLVAVYDSLVAFANGGLCNFGSQALFRKPGLLLRRLTTHPKNPMD